MHRVANIMKNYVIVLLNENIVSDGQCYCPPAKTKSKSLLALFPSGEMD